MLRLVLTMLFFLLSLLCIFRAPVYILWYVEIMVGEFPWIFSGLTCLLLLWGFGVKQYALPGTILGFVALGIFLIPVVGAYRIGESLSAGMENAFGKGSNQDEAKTPFTFFKMVTGIGAKQLNYTTLVYSIQNDTTLGLDFYAAQADGMRPCVVVVHGGSWSGGDSQQLPELNSELAKKGYNVASINYRMAPRYKNPAPIEDMHAALAYLRQHSEELHIDTNNFVLLGRSAGGQIVLLAAYAQHEPGLKGVISFYGPTDMVWGYNNPANPLVYDSKKVMERYIGCTYSECPQKFVASSPIEFVTNASVPTLLIQGRNDVLVAYEHATKLESKLASAGVKHFLLALPWATHGCDYTLNGPSGQLTTYTVERFLDAVINY